jgi:hypothetical protein
MKNLLKSKKLDMRFKANKGINRKTKVIAVILTLIIVLGLLFQLGMKIAQWFDTYAIVKQKVLTFDLNAPFRIEEREVEPVQIVQVINEVPEYEGLDEMQKYICDKWGMFRCATVIAIFKAESGLREDALNTYNSNNTVDFGVAQINSIHWNRDGCRLKEIVEWKGNIDCAYQIWDRADGVEGNGEGNFTPWSAFNSGSFKSKLD